MNTQPSPHRDLERLHSIEAEALEGRLTLRQFMGLIEDYARDNPLDTELPLWVRARLCFTPEELLERISEGRFTIMPAPGGNGPVMILQHEGEGDE